MYQQGHLLFTAEPQSESTIGPLTICENGTLILLELLSYTFARRIQLQGPLQLPCRLQAQTLDAKYSYLNDIQV